MGRASEVSQRGENRLAKEDMRCTGIGKDERGSNRTKQGSMGRVIVGIVRFQRGEGIGVKEPRDWFGGNNGRDKREGGSREG